MRIENEKSIPIFLEQEIEGQTGPLSRLGPNMEREGGRVHLGEKARWLPAATVLGLQLRLFKGISVCMGQTRTSQQELLLLFSHSLLGPLAMLLPLKSKQASKHRMG